MQEFEIIFYAEEDGSEPVKDFLDHLPKKMRAKMTRAIVMLQTCGTKLREPYSKSLDNGIFELRAQIATDITRVLYFFVVGRKIVLTNGFVKKTQKTPTSEIELAQRRRTKYLSRKETKHDRFQ